MNWKQNSAFEGQHAFLSPSQYHWINYSDEKLVETYRNMQAVEMGTKLHELASQCIKLKRKQPKTKDSFNLFVNDAIGFKMQSEQLLYYSPFCFGTADAISFRKNSLRIHDLKTGNTKAHFEQLEIYAAIFCLQYNYKPSDLDIELRIYQYDEIYVENPSTDIIVGIMEKIVSATKILTKMQEEEE